VLDEFPAPVARNHCTSLTFGCIPWTLDKHHKLTVSFVYAHESLLMSYACSLLHDMSVLDRSDYPSLSCGFPQASCISVPIVGMRVLVYGLEEIRDSSRPITALVRSRMP
jgi:hypothetical protein